MSQAPTEENEEISVEYKSAWDATRILTIQDGFSWSGNERNHVFLNMGAGRFADLSMISGSNSIGDGRAVATLDWDDDGKLDLVLKNRTGPRLQFFHNRYPGTHNYLVLELKGNGTTSNKDAIGARVVAELGGVEAPALHSTLYSSDGFLAQSSKRIHLGLGAADSVRRLTIRWPDGNESVHENLPINTRLRIVQDGDGPEPLAAQPVAAMEKLRSRTFEPEHNVSRAVLTAELPMAAVPLPGYDSPGRTVGDVAGRPLLINLWQITCLPCRKELFEFKERAAEIRRSGLRIVPMNVDSPSETDKAREIVAKYELALDAGIWNERLEKAVEVIYGEIFGERTNVRMPLPTSFLLDSHGNLAVVYLGRLNVDQLLADVAELEREDATPAVSRLSRGHQLVYYKRAFDELATRFDRAGMSALARYYRLVDSKTKSFFFEGGQKHELKGGNAKLESEGDVQHAALPRVEDQDPSANLDRVSESSR